MPFMTWPAVAWCLHEGETRDGERLRLLHDGKAWFVELGGERFAFRSERVARLAFEAACVGRAA